MPPAPLASGSENTPGDGVLYRVGTLRYTKQALFTMLFWMLWADLGLQLMELLQTIVPLQLKWMGASDKLIGLIRDGMQAGLTLLILPIIGTQSDRHRGPMGRRRPFLLWCTFPVCGFLLALGFAVPISHWIHGAVVHLVGDVSYSTVGLAMITFFVAGFFLFNNYVLQIYQYLIADIVPKPIMGKFVGAYRAIGAISGFIFNKYLFGHVETHIEWIYLSCTLFYAAGFFLLVWRVKEGEYPPPDHSQSRVGPIQFVRRYARECFTNGFYWKIYLTSVCYWVAIVPFYSFGMLYFVRDPHSNSMTSLGISPGVFGDIRAWTFLSQLIVFPICGILVDRFHSLRLLIFGFLGMSFCFCAGFGLAHFQPNVAAQPSLTEERLVTFSRPPGKDRMVTSEKVVTKSEIQQQGADALLAVPADAPAGTKKEFLPKYTRPAPGWVIWWWLGFMVMLAIIQLSYLAMFPALFPREKYGQFFSANQWIFSLGLMVGPFLCGCLLDAVADYRYIFAWSASFMGLAAGMSIGLFCHWKRLGGDKHYTPPTPAHGIHQ